MLIWPVEMFAQAPASPLMQAREQFFDASGRPLAFGKVYTYVGGTNTPQATYADSTGSSLSQNTNPILLDAGGYASIYIKCSDPTYKIVVKDSVNVTQWTEDGVQYPGCGGGSLTSLNSLTVGTQLFAVGTLGTDFNIVSSIDTHTFNLPTASCSIRGAVNGDPQVFCGNKTFQGDTLNNGALYVTDRFSTDHPIEITGETCGTAEANVGLWGFDTVTGLPCWSYDGSTPTSDLILNIVANGDLGTPADGRIVYCSNCNTPAAQGDACATGGDNAGAEAHRIRGGWKCY
jgi:hypothetical protein